MAASRPFRTAQSPLASSGLSRRSLLTRSALVGGGLLLPGALAACGNDSSSSGSGSGSGSSKAGAVSFQLSYLPSVEFAGYYLAQEKGYYKDEGVEAKLLDGGPSIAIEATVAAKKAMVGIDSADIIMQARNEGADFVIIGAQFQKNPLGIVSLAEAGVTSPQDLAGKKVGVGTSLTSAMTLWLESNDVDPSSVEMIPYQGEAGPIINGSIDAGLTFLTASVPLLDAQGVDTASFPFADFGYAVYNNAVFTTQQILDEREDDLVAFMRGSIRGWQDQLADPTEGVKLVTEKYGKSQGLSLESQELQSKAQDPLISTDVTAENGLFFMTDEDIQANLDTIKSLGIEADPAGFDTSVIKKAFDGKSVIDGA